MSSTEDPEQATRTAHARLLRVVNHTIADFCTSQPAGYLLHRLQVANSPPPGQSPVD